MTDGISSELAPYIPELERMYELTIKQNDVRGFFTHLHNYIESIDDNTKLSRLVWTLVIENYNQYNPDNKYKGDIKTLATGAEGQPYWDFMANVIADRRGVTRAYYCWLDLKDAFSFLDMEPAMLSELSKGLSNNTSLAVQNEIKEINNVINKNNDSGNVKFIHSDFQLRLEVFHTWIVSKTKHGGSSSVSKVATSSFNDVVSLTIKNKTLWLLVNKEQSQQIKKFDSSNGNNYKACRQLLMHKNKYLNKDRMGVSAAIKSPVKDLPKTMGLKGLLVDYFVDIDTKNQQLRLLDNVEIPHEELENLITFVKNNFQEK